MHEVENIIRAWKDDDYLMSLSVDEQRALPENPAGLIEFSGAEMNQAADINTCVLGTVCIYTVCW